MKKVLALTLSLVFILAGCSEGAVKTVTERFLNDSKDFSMTNESYVSENMSTKIDNERKDVLNEVLHSLGINKSSVEIKTIEGYDELLGNLEILKRKTEYEVNSVEVDDEKTKATVSINIKYVDVGEPAVKDISEALDRNILKAYSGEEVNEEEFLTMVIESLKQTLENFEYSELAKEENAEVKLIKRGKDWIIHDIDDKSRNAITLNFMKTKRLVLDSKLEETEENRVFLERESSLRAVFKEVQSIIKEDNGVNYGNLSKKADKVSKSLVDRLSVDSMVSDKLGDKDGSYYITKGPGKDELTVTITKGGEKFSFTDKVSK